MVQYFNYEGSTRGCYSLQGRLGLLARMHGHLHKLEQSHEEILAGRQSGLNVQYRPRTMFSAWSSTSDVQAGFFNDHRQCRRSSIANEANGDLHGTSIPCLFWQLLRSTTYASHFEPSTTYRNAYSIGYQCKSAIPFI